MRINIADTLTWGRIAAAPLLIYVSWLGRHDLFFAIAVYCMASDIVDGKIARWQGTASEFGARLDSWADLLMLLGAPVCAWLLQPQLLMSERLFVAAVFGGNVLAIAIGAAKFRQLTSYHTRAARLMAYLAGGGAIVAITWGWPWLFRVGALVGVYSSVEEIAITLTLPVWTANVRSLAAVRATRSRTPEGSTPT